jgi:hypothetical protein
MSPFARGIVTMLVLPVAVVTMPLALAALWWPVRLLTGWWVRGLAERSAPVGEATVASKLTARVCDLFPSYRLETSVGGLAVMASRRTYQDTVAGQTVALRRLPTAGSLPYVEGDAPTAMHAWPWLMSLLSPAPFIALVLGLAAAAVWLLSRRAAEGIPAGMETAPTFRTGVSLAGMAYSVPSCVWLALYARRASVLARRGTITPATVVDRLVKALLLSGARSACAGFVEAEWRGEDGLPRRGWIPIGREFGQCEIGSTVAVRWLDRKGGRRDPMRPFCAPADDPTWKQQLRSLRVILAVCLSLFVVSLGLLVAVVSFGMR